MAEDEVSEADLSGRLATVLEEIWDVMEKRKQRIEELRQEITNIENDNEELERTISELLDSFGWALSTVVGDGMALNCRGAQRLGQFGMRLDKAA